MFSINLLWRALPTARSNLLLFSKHIHRSLHEGRQPQKKTLLGLKKRFLAKMHEKYKNTQKQKYTYFANPARVWIDRKLGDCPDREKRNRMAMKMLSIQFGGLSHFTKLVGGKLEVSNITLRFSPAKRKAKGSLSEIKRGPLGNLKGGKEPLCLGLNEIYHPTFYFKRSHC